MLRFALDGDRAATLAPIRRWSMSAIPPAGEPTKAIFRESWPTARSRSRRRKVSRSGEKGREKEKPRNADRPGTHNPSRRIGPDGFYGSSDWADEIDWNWLAPHAPLPLGGPEATRRRTAASGDDPHRGW